MAERAPTVADAITVPLPRDARDDGVLVIAEAHAHVPFAIARMFTIQAPAGAVRGRHAHRRCSQFMLCVSGAVDVLLDDGAGQRTVSLARDNDALHVPPMIWKAVTFHAPQTVLVVLCDRPYEEDDYIRDYAAYLDARRALAP